MNCDFMPIDFFKQPLSVITGTFVIFFFCFLVVVSVALYPGQYNPLHSWLSNLGNVYLNPQGAFFFNLSCIITGIILIPFFIGLYVWRDIRIWNKISLYLGQFFGITSAIALVMIGFFPETDMSAHIFYASIFFVTILVGLFFINFALFDNPKFIKAIGYYGFLVITVDIIFLIILGWDNDILTIINSTTFVPGLEWATVLLSIGWVGFMAYNMIDYSSSNKDYL